MFTLYNILLTLYSPPPLSGGESLSLLAYSSRGAQAGGGAPVALHLLLLSVFSSFHAHGDM